LILNKSETGILTTCINFIAYQAFTRQCSVLDKSEYVSSRQKNL